MKRKKAILVVSFGTSHLDSLKYSIENIENKIKEEFKGYEVFRSFTSHMIISKLETRDNIKIFKPEEALEELKKEEFEDVIVQPLHMIAGEEFEYIKAVVESKKGDFNTIKLGRPILFYQGSEEEIPCDYTSFVESIKELIDGEESVVLFGHGTAHQSNAAYGMLQTVLEDEGYENVFIATVEGYPSIESCLRRMKRKGIRKTKLVPLLVVAGDHAKNDMASDEEDSLKSILKNEDIESTVYLHGLGELDSFANLYLGRIYDTIEDRYSNLGKSKKIRKIKK